MNSVDEIEYLVIPRPALATEYLCSCSNSKMTYYFLMEQQASILTFPDGLIPKILSGNISNAFSEVEWTKFPRKTYEHFLNWYLSAMLDCRQVAFSICEEVSCTPNLLSKSSPLTFVSCQDQTLQRDTGLQGVPSVQTTRGNSSVSSHLDTGWSRIMQKWRERSWSRKLMSSTISDFCCSCC